ncbi:MAG: DoxX family membrane protein [Planctomycetes bacterium]|nr:DoxX family membrane protein [Planctomycetota bacterium]
MAEETRRVPTFLNGPTTPIAVLLPMRLFVGYYWLQAGLAKLSAGWLGGANTQLKEMVLGWGKEGAYAPPPWFSGVMTGAITDNMAVFQWLVVCAQLGIGALVLAGAVTRITAAIAGLMAIIALIALGPACPEALPVAVMGVTCAIAAAGRYLGVDALIRVRNMQIPIF